MLFVQKTALFFIIVACTLSFGALHLARAQSTDQSVVNRRAQLEAELAQIEREIAAQQTILDGKRSERQSIERDIAILNAEIKKAQLEIRARNLAIGRLGGEITQKQQTIEELESKISRERESMAQLIRRRNEIDEFSVVEMVLGSKDLGDFFAEVDSFNTVKIALQASLNEIRTVQAETEEEKQILSQKQRAEVDARHEVETEKRAVERKEDEKQGLLAVTRSQERTYEQILEERQRRAAEIRSALFALRDTGAIPFGQALAFANKASAATGVRAAFILGILKQESNIGENVGQCYLKDPATGAGVGKNTGRFFPNVMKPDRDVEPFMRVTTALGFDPFTTPVSCPLSIGYGGAMGPSQFIGSTWVIYEPRLRATLGTSRPNPWEPEHAFMATALFLKDLGASGGGYSAEREAAARYYAGGGWATRGLGYADSVLAHAQDIQENMIDPLEGF